MPQTLLRVEPSTPIQASSRLTARVPGGLICLGCCGRGRRWRWWCRCLLSLLLIPIVIVVDSLFSFLLLSIFFLFFQLDRWSLLAIGHSLLASLQTASLYNKFLIFVKNLLQTCAFFRHCNNAIVKWRKVRILNLKARTCRIQNFWNSSTWMATSNVNFPFTKLNNYTICSGASFSWWTSLSVDAHDLENVCKLIFGDECSEN